MASEYSIVKELGRGAFGVVYLIKHKTEGEVFALKAVDLGKANPDEKKSAEKEAKVMSELDHDHVVRYVTSYSKGRTLFIYTEFCEGGDMAHFLEDSVGSLPEPLIVCWTAQTVSALEYLHARKILHRDLKPQNIYLSGEGDIKLGDLGIARVLEAGSDLASTMAGTPCYMSPEIFQQKGYNHKTDIWSFGCVVYELAAGERAFDAPMVQFLIFKIVGGTVPPIEGPYSTELKALVKSMMAKNPDDRPSATELLNRSPVKDFRARPKKPKDIMKESKFRTKWGTQESTVNLLKLLKLAISPGIREFSESDIQIPKEALAVYRERVKRRGAGSRLPLPSVDQEQTTPKAAGAAEAAGAAGATPSKAKGNIYSSIMAPKGQKVKAKVGEKNMDVTMKVKPEEPSAGGAAIAQAVRSLAGGSDDTVQEKGDGTTTKKAVEAKFLMRQIEVLQRHCAQGLGEDTLRRAYAILETVPNPVQLKAQLVGLLGDDKFQQYGDKIMYLRLFEVGLNKVQTRLG